MGSGSERALVLHNWFGDSRIRSENSGARRGTLLLIPGGPGSSGINGP